MSTKPSIDIPCHAVPPPRTFGHPTFCRMNNISTPRSCSRFSPDRDEVVENPHAHRQYLHQLSVPTEGPVCSPSPCKNARTARGRPRFSASSWPTIGLPRLAPTGSSNQLTDATDGLELTGLFSICRWSGRVADGSSCPCHAESVRFEVTLGAEPQCLGFPPDWTARDKSD